MTSLKKHIAYTFLVLLVASVATGIMGATGIVPIQQAGLIGLFSLSITQSVAVIIAIIKAPNYFDDPPAVAKLKQEHLNAMSHLQKLNTELEAKLKQSDAQLQKLTTDLKAKDTDLKTKDAEMDRLRKQIPPKRGFPAAIMLQEGKSPIQ